MDFRRGSAEKHLRQHIFKDHYILIGANRLGRGIISALEKSKEAYVVVDFNPRVVEKLHNSNIPSICGDFTDSFIQELANLKQAKFVISTIPDMHDNLAIITAIKSQKTKTKLIVTAGEEHEALRLYEQKVDYVLLPHFIGADHLKAILEEKNRDYSLKNLKTRQLKHLSWNH